mmetsp:Transcript_14204/g.45546  ORF Transcript_14204/g.45546 Transcript_14204/m.45546 type:complete len:200 (+) Transcript_14204:1100-1699(+)
MLVADFARHRGDAVEDLVVDEAGDAAPLCERPAKVDPAGPHEVVGHEHVKVSCFVVERPSRLKRGEALVHLVEELVGLFVGLAEAALEPQQARLDLVQVLRDLIPVDFVVLLVQESALQLSHQGGGRGDVLLGRLLASPEAGLGALVRHQQQAAAGLRHHRGGALAPWRASLLAYVYLSYVRARADGQPSHGGGRCRSR